MLSNLVSVMCVGVALGCLILGEYEKGLWMLILAMVNILAVAFSDAVNTYLKDKS